MQNEHHNSFLKRLSKGADGMVQLTDCLPSKPSKLEALILSPNTNKKKKKKKDCQREVYEGPDMKFW
jgi:hypothetical protein